MLARRDIAPRAVEFLDLLQPCQHCLVALVVERERRRGQIVEQRFQFLVEQRQPVFDADRAPSGTDRFVERIVMADGPEQLAIAGAEALDRRLVEQHLAHRLQREALQRGAAALAHRVEAADRFQSVAEQVEAQRLGRARREQIDDTAAQRVFARLAHRVGAPVAVMGEERNQLLDLQCAADLGREHHALEHPARRHALQDGVDGGDHHPPAAGPCGRIGQDLQGINAPADDRAIGRHAVIGQTVPSREGQHLQRRVEKRQRLGQRRHARVVTGHMDQIAARGGDLHQRQGIAAGRGADDRNPAGFGEEMLQRPQRCGR